MARRIAERVARRFQAAKALDPEKLKQHLLQIRKGTGKRSLPQWITVLEALGGWRCEPIVGLVQIHLNENTERVADDRNTIDKIWNEIKNSEVSTLPANPVHGKHYTMAITEPREHHGLWGVRYKLWMGAQGVRVTAPNGKIFDVLPGRYELSGGNAYDPEYRTIAVGKILVYDFEKWLYKETDLKQQASDALNMPTHEAEREQQKPRTRDGTGTCPCCFRNIKLAGENIVLHGYKRPGWGSVQGRCFGVNWPAFEISCEGTKALVKNLQEQLKSSQDFHQRLEAGEVQKLYDDKGNEILPNSPKWKRLFEKTVQETAQLIKWLGKDIQLLEKLIREWKPSELPREGDKIKQPPALLL